MFLFKVVSEFFKKLHLVISTRHNDIIIPLFNFHLKWKEKENFKKLKISRTKMASFVKPKALIFFKVKALILGSIFLSKND